MNTFALDKDSFAALKAAKEPVYLQLGGDIIGRFTPITAPLSDYDPEEDTPEQHKIWAEKAKIASKSGYISMEESMAYLKRALNVKH